MTKILPMSEENVRLCVNRMVKAETKLEKVRNLEMYDVTFVDKVSKLRVTHHVVNADDLIEILELE